ncbi:DUF1799 domain-containing protein [Thioalbus denitrificans]|uniref:Uncharacterized protein DUF1799 n=1 Tax=Thioalbus denitrificans TaxID=547122 RepID=A0A369CET2_9GAMM|nr:DUF1799 domain-containing protein [Thioalbus denitrificans]RCX32081.1 uncharacterized protein DUF1799 [Thioalbus denitrificans]
MAADGAGPEICKGCREARDDDGPCEACPEPELLPMNTAAATAWLELQSQWRRDAWGRATGLDYAGVAAWFRLAGVPRRERTHLFGQIRQMEAYTLEAIRERADKTHGKDPH